MGTTTSLNAALDNDLGFAGTMRLTRAAATRVPHELSFRSPVQLRGAGAHAGIRRDFKGSENSMKIPFVSHHQVSNLGRAMRVTIRDAGPDEQLVAVMDSISNKGLRKWARQMTVNGNSILATMPRIEKIDISLAGTE